MKTVLNMIVLLFLTGFSGYSQKTIIESNRELFDRMQSELRTIVDGIRENLNQMGFQPVVKSPAKETDKIIEPQVIKVSDSEISPDINITNNIPDIYPTEQEPRLSSFFGYRSDPFTGKQAFHYGVDIPVDEGSDVRSTGSGKVIRTAYDRINGNYIIVDHGNSYQSIYGHLSRRLVQKGDAVLKGQVIGKSGNTGRSTGPHIHYGILFKGNFINPLSVIR